MGWVTDGFVNEQRRHSRFEPVPENWLEMQRRLGRWGGGQTWRRLEHLGEIARIDQ